VDAEELELADDPEVVPDPPFEVELVPELELPEPLDDFLALLAVGGDAVPVVGTDSAGAPVVSLLPAPLEPQPATAITAAQTASAVSRTRRF